MVRLLQTKYIYQSLKKVYGLNKQTIKKIIGILCLKQKALFNIENKNIRNKLNEMFLTMIIDFKLRLITFSRIILLIYTKTYRGMRHIQGLPSRGQRTHANGKTPKALKTMGKNLPFRLKRKTTLEITNNLPKRNKPTKKKIKLSKKQKGKLKAKQKTQKKKK